MKSDALLSRRRFRHRAAAIMSDRGATSHLSRSLCLTHPRNLTDQRWPRDEGHAPAVVADIAVGALAREARRLQFGRDLVLAVALEPDARAQMAVIRQRGADQPDHRVLQEAVTQAEGKQRRHV